MKKSDINIRDPFVLVDDGTYYMYGTRAANFGCKVAGFDCYTSKDLIEWSDPIQVFDSEANGMNKHVNWAPEVHKYNGAYYMFASFTQVNGLRGTFCLKADNPLGPFVLHSEGALTPHRWECIDGTLYIENGTPYLMFCHEHTQIMDGGMCYIELSDDLKTSVGEPVTIFKATDPYYIKRKVPFKHYVTDGPFMLHSKDGTLFMIWSTSLYKQYAECIVRFNEGTIKGSFEHLEPLIDNDGGHGMIFESLDGKLMFTYHTPNQTDYERPEFVELNDCGDHFELKK